MRHTPLHSPLWFWRIITSVLCASAVDQGRRTHEARCSSKSTCKMKQKSNMLDFLLQTLSHWNPLDGDLTLAVACATATAWTTGCASTAITRLPPPSYRSAPVSFFDCAGSIA